MARINSQEQIEAMRHSGRILAEILEKLQRTVKAGLTPADMAELAARELKLHHAEPAFLGYQGYPSVICISVNDQVQHSIPSKRPFQKGDVVNFDFGVRYGGMITDAGISVCVGGKPSADDHRLLSGTQAALAAGLAEVKAGVSVGDVSAVIEEVLREYKLGIVRELVGHGVGEHLHEDPEIPNYGRAGSGPKLQAGMTIAIEPIATLGSPKIYIEPDRWTIRTSDGSRAAQFEHTVLVTREGCEVLTKTR